jgi:hypothetical protein
LEAVVREFPRDIAGDVLHVVEASARKADVIVYYLHGCFSIFCSFSLLHRCDSEKSETGENLRLLRFARNDNRLKTKVVRLPRSLQSLAMTDGSLSLFFPSPFQ